jgi:Flp pilus assembly protein TadD
MKQNNKKHQHLQSNKEPVEEKKSIVSKTRDNSALFIVIAFCLPVLLYLQTIGFGFTHFDDDGIILNNITFLSHLGNAFHAFITDAFIAKMSSFYRPLQTLSYMVDIQLSGASSVWMFHLSNILLLGIISCLLFLLLKRFLIPIELALLATLIYCAHPLFVSSVAWIPARGDILLLLFSVLSFIFFIDFLQKRKTIYILLNWLAFTIALFCKETAAFLPFLFIIYFFTFSNEKRFDRKYLLIIILYALSGMFWYWMRSKAVGDSSNSNDILGLAAVMLNLQTMPESLAQFFLPFDNAPIPGFSFFKTLTGLIIIALLIVLLFRNRKRTAKEKIFALSWFLLLMLPPMLFKHPLIDYLDHRFFLPLIGILLFILFLLSNKWFEKANSKSYWVLIALFVVLSSFTFIKSRSYSDPITFYNTAISKNPNSALAYNNRGHLKLSAKDYQGALSDYNKAISINPSFSDAYSNRGFMKFKLGDKHGAIDDCNIAISLNSKFVKAYCIRGFANMSLANYNMAIDDFDKAIHYNPNFAEAYNGKGTVLNSMGNFREAIVTFTKAVELDPKGFNAYYNRARSKFSLKDFTGASDDCDKVLQLNPNDEKALNLKARIKQELQKEGNQ